ncbi:MULTISPECIES: hypothetical protein [Streptomyces]|uniref:Uncharacterized protein n=1 Tax=Streptomyces griseosporeus TaxID=1910 RepID=A0ABV3KHS1_STRGS|nr:hypothetical protein [Streptomyces actuosus]
MGLLLYGVTRFGNAAFYARLGTTPDEIGIDHAVLLDRVAGVIFLFVTVVGLAAILFYVALRSATPWWASIVAGVVGLCLSVAAIGGFFGVNLKWWGVAFILAVCGVVTLVTGQLERKPDSHRQWLGVWRAKLTASAIAALALLLAMFTAAGVAGYRAAGYIERGQPLPCNCLRVWFLDVNFRWFAGTEGFLGIDPKSVKPVWISSTLDEADRRRLAHHSLFILGTHDSTHYVFDSTERQMLRIPASLFIFSTSK